MRWTEGKTVYEYPRERDMDRGIWKDTRVICIRGISKVIQRGEGGREREGWEGYTVYRGHIPIGRERGKSTCWKDAK